MHRRVHAARRAGRGSSAAVVAGTGGGGDELGAVERQIAELQARAVALRRGAADPAAAKAVADRRRSLSSAGG